MISSYFLFFFFNDTATTEIYTLSLHDALPISAAANKFLEALDSGQKGKATFEFKGDERSNWHYIPKPRKGLTIKEMTPDRKSTRLNSSHLVISYAVFCLKKKKTTLQPA